ncbi:nucleoside-diphosphate kinase [Paenibacillus glycanilyticus]|uniref:nucleoside-diphosphate kinase n=1 Tax=Paenibacillus glycanilyticus TaxID=126569 RepID=UPI00203E16D7|nr:nucleoside-diphosphate kinase [Paenibacillus glycanilyticus]MCM3630454.1 nucleoside-diphosphate kinase [Paenibacillus glycanilyticus]
MNERAFIIIKPDGVRRGLIGEIVNRFEKKGLRPVYAELKELSGETARSHYGHLKEQVFFDELIAYMTSGPVFAMIVEGRSAVANARSLIGPTNPVKAPPGTIRGDYGSDIDENVIHSSDSLDHASREIQLFFGRTGLLHKL